MYLYLLLFPSPQASCPGHPARVPCCLQGSVCSALTAQLHRCSDEVTRQIRATAAHKVGRDGILATRLCTHQDDVALTNERQLRELPGEQGARAEQGHQEDHGAWPQQPGQGVTRVARLSASVASMAVRFADVIERP